MAETEQGSTEKAAPTAKAPRPASSGVAAAARSGGFDAERLVSWVVTLGVIGIAGLILFLVRAHVAVALERLPAVSLPHPEGPAAAEIPVVAPPEEPKGPQLTWDDIAEALDPVPDRLRELVAASREELPELVKLQASSANEALVRNRWQSWSHVWLNRVEAVQKQLPPDDECALHDDLAPACAKFTEILGILREVVAGDASVAGETVDRAETTLETFLNPPPEVPADELAPGESPDAPSDGAAEPASTEG